MSQGRRKCPKKSFTPLKNIQKRWSKERQEGGIYKEKRTRLKLASKERLNAREGRSKGKNEDKILSVSRQNAMAEEEASSPGEW